MNALLFLVQCDDCLLLRFAFRSRGRVEISRGTSRFNCYPRIPFQKRPREAQSQKVTFQRAEATQNCDISRGTAQSANT